MKPSQRKIALVALLFYLGTQLIPAPYVFALRAAQPEVESQRSGLEEALTNPGRVLERLTDWANRPTPSAAGSAPQSGLEEGTESFAQIRDLLRQPGNTAPTFTPLEIRRGLLHVDVRSTENYFYYLWNEMKERIVLIAGKTGEADQMTPALRRETIDVMTPLAVEQGFGVLVHVTGESVPETLRLAQLAKEKGAQSLVVAPMALVQLEDSAAILKFIRNLHHIGLPIILYDNPDLGGLLDFELVKQLWYERLIVGLKDSSGNITRFVQWLDLGSEFLLSIGDESLIAQAMDEAQKKERTSPIRTVGSSGSFWKKIREIALEKDPERRWQLQSHINGQISTVRGGNIPATGKRILRRLNVIANDVTVRRSSMSPMQQGMADTFIEQAGLTRFVPAAAGMEEANQSRQTRGSGRAAVAFGVAIVLGQLLRSASHRPSSPSIPAALTYPSVVVLDGAEQVKAEQVWGGSARVSGRYVDGGPARFHLLIPAQWEVFQDPITVHIDNLAEGVPSIAGGRVSLEQTAEGRYRYTGPAGFFRRKDDSLDIPIEMTTSPNRSSTKFSLVVGVSSGESSRGGLEESADVQISDPVTLGDLPEMLELKIEALIPDARKMGALSIRLSVLGPSKEPAETLPSSFGVVEPAMETWLELLQFAVRKAVGDRTGRWMVRWRVSDQTQGGQDLDAAGAPAVAVEAILYPLPNTLPMTHTGPNFFERIRSRILGIIPGVRSTLPEPWHWETTGQYIERLIWTVWGVSNGQGGVMVGGDGLRPIRIGETSANVQQAISEIHSQLSANQNLDRSAMDLTATWNPSAAGNGAILHFSIGTPSAGLEEDAQEIVQRMIETNPISQDEVRVESQADGGITAVVRAADHAAVTPPRILAHYGILQKTWEDVDLIILPRTPVPASVMARAAFREVDGALILDGELVKSEEIGQWRPEELQQLPALIWDHPQDEITDPDALGILIQAARQSEATQYVLRLNKIRTERVELDGITYQVIRTYT